MGLLCLLWSGNFACTDGPNWFVSNNDVSPLRGRYLIGNSLELSSIDLVGLSRLSFIELLSDASHDSNTVVDSGLGLLGDIFIGFMAECSSLGVTSEGPFDTNVLELIGSDVTGVCTLSILRNILSHDMDIVLDFFLGQGQVDVGWSNAHCHLV